MTKLRLALATALAALIAAPAAAVVIDFDDIATGATVTTQYAGVTFSSGPGNVVLTTDQSAAYGTSTPNFICSGTNQINCTAPIYLDFATAVSGLSFLAVGDNDVGIVGNASVYAGATLLGGIDIIGDGIGQGAPYLVDLSAFSGITRLAITTTDAAGLGYDDFRFTPGSAAAVPEPASWAMLVFGFAAIGSAMRRRLVGAARAD